MSTYLRNHRMFWQMGGYCLSLMICVIRSGIRIFNANILCDPSLVLTVRTVCYDAIIRCQQSTSLVRAVQYSCRGEVTDRWRIITVASAGQHFIFSDLDLEIRR